MLTLARYEKEQIVVTFPDGRRGTITVWDISGNKIRLALDFPTDIAINRGEVQAEIDQEAVRAETDRVYEARMNRWNEP